MRYVESNILAVQKQSLCLGQIIVRVRIELLWTKKKFQSKLWHKNIFIKTTGQIDIMGYKVGLLLTDIADTLNELRKKKLYWLYKLRTYAPYSLSERDIYEAVYIELSLRLRGSSF